MLIKLSDNKFYYLFYKMILLKICRHQLSLLNIKIGAVVPTQNVMKMSLKTYSQNVIRLHSVMQKFLFQKHLLKGVNANKI